MAPRTHLPKYEIGAHFLTAKTYHNIPFFKDPACARIFCEELEAARAKYGFHVLAFVVMPDHIHLLLWWDTNILPDLAISKVAWAVKGLSARRMVQYLQSIEERRVGDGSAVAYPKEPALQPIREPRDQPHYRNWRYKIWQQGAGYDFNVYTPRKLQEKVAYIHANPIRTGLASSPEAYPWFSAANYRVAEGNGGVGEGNGGVGEGNGGVGEGNAFTHPVRVTLYTEIF